MGKISLSSQCLSLLRSSSARDGYCAWGNSEKFPITKNRPTEPCNHTTSPRVRSNTRAPQMARSPDTPVSPWCSWNQSPPLTTTPTTLACEAMMIPPHTRHCGEAPEAAHSKPWVFLQVAISESSEAIPSRLSSACIISTLRAEQSWRDAAHLS